jgi:hypothetical protein
MAEKLTRTEVDQTYGRTTNTTQTGGGGVRTTTKTPQITSRSSSAIRTTNKGPQNITKSGGSTKTITKTPDIVTKSGSTERVTTKDAYQKVVLTDSSGSSTRRNGDTQTTSGQDTAQVITVEGPDNRVRTTTRTGAENKSGIEFTFKIKIQNRNAVNPATLAGA